jgi:hypothetical protein
LKKMTDRLHFVANTLKSLRKKVQRNLPRRLNVPASAMIGDPLAAPHGARLVPMRCLGHIVPLVRLMVPAMVRLMVNRAGYRRVIL